MKYFHNQEIEKILSFFHSSEEGLSVERVGINRKKYGKNEIKEKERKSKPRVFLEQFEDFLVIILIASAIISTFIGEIESMIVIFLVITINAILGTHQHFKAEKSMDSLKKLSSPNVRVIRNGQKIIISSSEVVCGDIVIIKSGDLISADGRIISEQGLEVNESALNGESVAVSKHSHTINKEDVGISDQNNMLFSGTYCVKGSGKYIVCKTGMKTELGKIAKIISQTKIRKTPLQNNLDTFSKGLAVIIIFICFVVFLMGIYRNISILDSLMFSVALAVAAIPEALSTIVVIVLAIGTERMANENAIIKELKAVEGLGCINVICTDKTGTLTQNKMEIRDTIYECNEEFFKIVLVNSCGENNATEEAIYNFLNGFTQENAIKIYELPFTSTRKMMSTVYKYNSMTFLYVKGSSEVLLTKIKFIKEQNNIKIATKEILDKISHKVDELSQNGLRVIMFAYKELGFKEKINEEDEKDLIYVGLVSIVDPLRKESFKAVRDCLSAGIKPVMLTGDHKETALYIAREVGIYKNDDLVVTGEELDKMSDTELGKQIERITVFSRLNPIHKIRIVKVWQKRGGIVAMTGDGINDAPAIRQADIGIAMGKSGTEVAKEASSIILADDDFATIIKAVANGRNVYQNIQNAIRFLLSGNFAGILVVLLASFLNFPLPFVAVHLLFINLLTDSLPAIAIGMEDGNNKDLLLNKPRKKTEHFLNKRMLEKIIFEGVLIGFFTLYGYLKGLKENIDVARTMAFSILCLGRLFHSFNCVRAKSIFVTGLKNTYLLLSVLIGIVLINAVLFIPELRTLIVVVALSRKEIIYIYALSLMPTFILQFLKIIKYRKKF